MKTADASLFMVAANGRTKRESGLGMPYASHATKALGMLTMLKERKACVDGAGRKGRERQVIGFNLH